MTVRWGAYLLTGITCLGGLNASAQSALQPLWSVAAHSSTITDVAVAADGAFLATSSFDRSVKLWRTADGAALGTLTGHAAEVKSVAISRDGRLVAAGGYDRTVRVWRVADGQLVLTLVGHADTVRSVAFSPDGTMLASGSQDRQVNLWRVSDGALVQSLSGNAGWVMSVSFSPDGALVASGGADRAVSLWRVADGQLVGRWFGHGDWVMSVAFSPNGLNLASAGVDFSVKVWDVASGSVIRTLGGFTDAVNYVAYSTDGASLVTADWTRGLNVWNAADGSLERSFTESSLINGVQFTPDGGAVAYGRADGVLVLAANAGSGVAPAPALDAVAGTEKSSYVNREKAKIVVSVTDGNAAVVGANVTTTVTSSKGIKTTLRGTTGANGVVVLTYTVSSKQGTGTYRIDSVAAKTGFTSATDSCSFTVLR